MKFWLSCAVMTLGPACRRDQNSVRRNQTSCPAGVEQVAGVDAHGRCLWNMLRRGSLRTSGEHRVRG